jgi:hypothetical protein
MQLLQEDCPARGKVIANTVSFLVRIRLSEPVPSGSFCISTGGKIKTTPPRVSIGVSSNWLPKLSKNLDSYKIKLYQRKSQSLVFLSERLYFGLVASLAPNRQPRGCHFGLSLDKGNVYDHVQEMRSLWHSPPLSSSQPLDNSFPTDAPTQ